MFEKQSNKERIKEITAGIEKGIMELFESDRYRNYLTTMSRFHRYSLNNVKFDHFVKETLRMKEYMRYMDDFFMVAQTKEELEEVLPKINSYLNALGLSTHPTKTKIFHQNKKMRVLGFDFHVTKTGKVIMQIDPKNVKDRRKNIYRCAQLVRKGEMTREKADEMFRAWLNHASKGDNPKMIKRMHEYYQQCMEG